MAIAQAAPPVPLKAIILEVVPPVAVRAPVQATTPAAALRVRLPQAVVAEDKETLLSNNSVFDFTQGVGTKEFRCLLFLPKEKIFVQESIFPSRILGE